MVKSSQIILFIIRHHKTHKHIFILSCIAAKDLQRLQHTGESYLWTHTKINIDYGIRKCEFEYKYSSHTADNLVHDIE